VHSRKVSHTASPEPTSATGDSAVGSVAARAVSKPSQATSKTYGDWPHGDRAGKNRDLQASFAVPSSLAGPHVIDSTYAPKIEFTLPADKTFMEAVRYTATGVQPSGAIGLGWSAVPRATGYSIAVMAPERMGDDSANIVMWTSAERPATFVMMEDLTPAEANRLIGLKAVLPPTTTTCTIPAEVVKATKGKLKGKPQPDVNLRDTENVPLSEDVETYFKREVLPHALDAWIDHEKTKVGYEIPFNRHFYVFKPPRPLAEIDADLKQVTDRILTMLGGLSR